MSQVMYRRRCEVAFGAFQPQVMVTQCSQDGVDVLQMRRPRGTIDQDVVKKHKDKLTQERLEHCVHETLECRRCIGQPEGHD